MLRGPQHRNIAHSGPDDVLVIDDTFSSNPAGAVIAIGTLRRRVSGRRVVVTPGMVELGSDQYRANVELAATVVESGATLLAVGRINRRPLLEGAGGNAVTVPSRREARNWIQDNLGQGDGVLWENDLPDHYP